MERTSPVPLHIVLHEPEIPQNTGTIGRTCVAIGARLHLIKPLGFSLADKYLKRAGLDYWQYLDLQIHPGWTSFKKTYPNANLWYFSKKAENSYYGMPFGKEAFLVFGKETAGLTESILAESPRRCLRIPMKSEARCLNLAVAVGIAAYEVLRG